MFKLLLTVPTLLLTLSACSNSVNGSVNGDGVNFARQAYFDVYEYDLGWLGQYYFTGVLLSDVGSSCDALEELSDALSEGDCEERCEDYAVAADTYLGSGDHWTVYIGAWEEDASDIVGEYSYSNDTEEGTFGASYTRFNASLAQDQDACEDACEEGDDLLSADDETGEDGVFIIESHEPNVRMTGEFELDFGGEDRLSGNFDASPCNLE